MAKRTPLKLFNPEEIKRSIAPLADQLPSSRPATSIEILPPEPGTVDDYVRVIDRLWDETQKGFLAIGQHLEEAQQKLPAEDFAYLVSRLRFGKAVRSQLMTAYRAVKSGLIPDGVEAAGYSVVYQIANLSETERQQAVKEGVIHPGVRRQDIVKFKAKLRTHPSEEEANRAELARLEAEQARIGARIAELRAKLGQVVME